MVPSFVDCNGKHLYFFYFLRSLIPYPRARPPAVRRRSFPCLTSPSIPNIRSGLNLRSSALLRVPAPDGTPQSLQRGPAPSRRQPLAARPRPPRPSLRVRSGFGPGRRGSELRSSLLGSAGRSPRRPAARPRGSHGLAGAAGERAGPDRVLL